MESEKNYVKDPLFPFAHEYESLEHERKVTIKAAQDLRYPKIVITRLRAAKTGAEMTNIMKDARNGLYT